MYDITPIIEAAGLLFATVITCVLVPYIKSKTTFLFTSFDHFDRVLASEDYQAWLKEHGVKVDETELDALIEAAVYELNQGIIPIEGVTIETTTEVEREEQTDHE